MFILLIYLLVSFVALALMGFELYSKLSWKKRVQVKDVMPMLAAFIPMFNIVLVVIGIAEVYRNHFADVVLWQKK